MGGIICCFKNVNEPRLVERPIKKSKAKESASDEDKKVYKNIDPNSQICDETKNLNPEIFSIDHQKIAKELEEIVNYQKEKIKSLEEELEKRNKEIFFDDEDTLQSRTLYIGYLEGNKEDLAQQYKSSERNYEEEIMRLKLDRDQIKEEFIALQNNYSIVYEHYTSLYNQYITMTSHTQAKLD